MNVDIKALVAQAHQNSKEHGFWDGQKREAKYLGVEGEAAETLAEFLNTLDPEAVAATIPEKLCLIHSEVSEALECYRDGEMHAVYAYPDPETGEKRWLAYHRDGLKPEGFPNELADICIRVFDLAGALGIDLEDVIVKKMAYNAGRPHKHGKVC